MATTEARESTRDELDEQVVGLVADLATAKAQIVELQAHVDALISDGLASLAASKESATTLGQAMAEVERLTTDLGTSQAELSIARIKAETLAADSRRSDMPSTAKGVAVEFCRALAAAGVKVSTDRRHKYQAAFVRLMG